MQAHLNVVLVIPTGIGAAIGGYAGDGLPVARAIAAVADVLITHPNVVNGASLYWPLPNLWYVEGYTLDRFAMGEMALRPTLGNRIGVILDRGMEPELQVRHRQAIAAARATLGLSIPAVVETDQPLAVHLQWSETGVAWGTLRQPDSLLRAVDALQGKVEAIAVVARFPDDPDSPQLQAYRQGRGVDALAGAEAVISHLVTRHCGLPCAHAPALQPLPLDPTVADRACAEELGYTFLPCVLAGLSRAPHLCDRPQPNDLQAHHIQAVVTPYDACGGAALLALGERGALPIFVRENTTALAVPPTALGLSGWIVANYREAIGVLAALKAGVDPQRLGLAPIP
ncbi:MAG TPA: hypothetical protein DCQ32_09060 [Cyanobacteria bacterium UBA8156]|nr:hypothetical protein [Cyanobacteria bacterium UBA8156]